MNPMVNPFSEINRAALESAAKFTRISLDNAERTLNVQLEYTKGAFTQAAHTARAVAQAKDVQELFSLRSRIAENSLENLIGYSRSLYEVASGTQSEISRLAEERMASFQRAMSEGVDQAAKSAPGGSDLAVAAMKSSLAATTAAFDSFSKAAKNMASYADAGVTASRTAKSRK
jgi:phasin family protein